MTAPVAFEVSGDGEPLVLLHGWGLNAAVWRGCSEALAATHRVIALDLPGHGRSEWIPAAASFGEQTKLIAAALPDAEHSIVGWSLGGLFATALAMQLGQRLRRLILVGATPRFTVAPDWPDGLSADTVGKFALHLATNYRGTVNDFLELQTRGSAHAAAVLTDLRRSLSERGDASPAALTSGLEILDTCDLRLQLPLVTSPTLLISGQYDRITPPAAIERFTGLLPRSEHVMIGRAGHAPFLSHTARFVQEVSAFLDDHA